MKRIYSLITLLLALMFSGNLWAAGYTRTLTDELEVAGYKANTLYDFQNNNPEVLPTSGDLRYRDGGTWGLHNFGSGTRSATVSIPVTAGQLLVVQHYSTAYATINGVSYDESLSATAGYQCYKIANDADNLTVSIARYGGLVAALLMDVDASAATADYTLNYLYSGSPVKTVTANGAVGGTVLTDASFFVDDVKYFRADGEPESFNIAAEGNTFNVNVRMAATYNYTLKDNSGAVIASGTGLEGETVTSGYSRYKLADGKFYEAGQTNKEYRKGITLTEDNATATVDYSEKTDVNAVLFVEGENIVGMTSVASGNIPARASNALAGVASEDIAITTLPAGKYIVHAGIFTSKSSYGENTVNFAIGTETFSAAFTNVNLCEVASEEYTMNAETEIKFLGTTSWGDAQLDYIWIEKTGDVTPNKSELMQEAEALAADEDAVAVGKLIDAIDAAKTSGDETELATAVNQFKTDNADQEKDETAKVDTSGWKKFEGNDAAGVCATEYAPAITTYDGRTANLAENYESTTETTGQIIYQNITGLENGQYKVGFYGNAFYTSGRGFDSTMEDGATDVAYVFANDQKEFITARIATSTTENDFRQFDVEVTDGTIKLGMGKEKAGTNWHTMQIYQLTWFTTAKAVYAADKAEMNDAIAAAEALAADETKTNGKEELNRAIEDAKAAVADNHLNVPELEAAIKTLNDAIATFKTANYVSVLMQEAEALAADEDAVAVGKLIDAIDAAKTSGDETELATAVNQFKTDNADLEKDETAKVDTSGWKKFNGNDAAGVCGTGYAPAITTYDGRTANLAENYESTTETTGQIIYQNITGLENGQYKVGFYGNAFYTSGRGFDSTMEDGATDVAYVFANDQKEFITARIATSTTENDFRQFDVEVTDGTIKLGMGKEQPGTNWHTMQIYQLTWFTTAKAVYAADKAEMNDAIAAAEALAADENKTNGKEELNRAIEDAKAAVADNHLNIPELEAAITALNNAISTCKKANYVVYDGAAYIIDAETGKAMAAGHNYGTRGIVNTTGLDLTLTSNAETCKVTIDSQVSNGGDNHFLGSNLYMDAPAFEWILEANGTGYSISDGIQYLSVDESDNLVLSNTPRTWNIVPAADRIAEWTAGLANAKPTAPVDATFLLKNPNFNRNDLRVNAWTVSDDCTNKNLNGGNDVNNCAESYHSTFTISQTVENVPAGVYALIAQGFYRQDGEATDAPVFFINDETATVPVKTGEENSMANASESFSAGYYTIKPVFAMVGVDGTLNVGVKSTVNSNWVIFDNFTLTYYGEVEPGDVNCDNETAISDVTLTVNFALEKKQPTPFQKFAADRTKDGAVAVEDAVDIVNIIMAYDYSAAVEPTAKARESETDMIAVNGNQLSLTNSNEYVAFQMDINVDGQFNGATLTERAADHQIVYNKVGENTWRIIGISMANKAFNGNAGALVNFDIDGTYTVSTAKFITLDTQAYYLNIGGEATGISSVSALNAEAKAIYTPAGVRVNTLQKGLNIVRKADGTTMKVFVK